jgi:hypothetical protein
MNKALTVKQPWAWAIIHGDKDVENRSRPTKHRGQLYIHAGLGWAAEGDEALAELGDPEIPLGYDYAGALAARGMVIGTVDVIGCHPAEECADGIGRHCSEWAMPGHFHWILANARPLACPFPETGRLGLWTLGGAVLTAVR